MFAAAGRALVMCVAVFHLASLLNAPSANSIDAIV